MDMKKAIERLDEECKKKEFYQMVVVDYDEFWKYIHSRDIALLEAVKGEIESKQKELSKIAQNYGRNKELLMREVIGIGKALSVLDNLKDGLK